MLPRVSRALLLLLCSCQYGLTANRGGPGREPVVPYNACLAPDGERATGTWDDPIVVAELPFVDAGDTTDAASDEADAWDCEADLDRSGAEVVYALTLDGPTDVHAELNHGADAGVTLQLVPADAEVADGHVAGCLSSGALTVDAVDLPAGDYLLVVDTVRVGSGETKPGAYTLTVESVPRVDLAARAVDLAEGLQWYRGRAMDPDGVSIRAWNAFLVDLTARDATPRPHETCQTVDVAGAELGARVGVNGGFQGDSCRSLDLVRAEGVTFSTNDYADSQRVLGWNAGGPPELEWVARGQDYTAFDQAIGSYPSLIDRGLITVEPAGNEEFFTARQARTALGVTADDELLIFVADGGTTEVPGLTLGELASSLAELGAVEAVNLDGAGAATAWVSGCSATGVVSRPTGGGGTTHGGAVAVPDGLYVF